jgi:hypothetical protein
MSSGRIQLASVGIQDYFLTDNPDVTFFKQVYKKHTKFALETLDNTFDDQANFDTIVRCVVPRKGDLIRNIYFRVELPALVNENVPDPGSIGYTDSIGNAIIEYADLIIGGQLVERITGEYIEIYNQLYFTDSKQKSFEYLVGTTGSRTGLGIASETSEGVYGKYPRNFVVPLPFYFNNHEPLCIPLTALAKQEVEVQIKIRPLSELIVTSTTEIGILRNAELINATLPVEYVFIGDDENTYLQNSKLDYLITQVQVSRSSIIENVTNAKYRLNFVNPVKEMFFVVQNANVIQSNIYTGNDFFNYTNPENTFSPSGHHIKNIKMSFNDEEIIDNRVADTIFLNSLQPMITHSRVPKEDRKFYVYSFSIDPESYYPTGQINMSRIQNQVIDINLFSSSQKRDIRIYSTSYNVLRIKDGLAGMLFIDNNTI